MTKEDILEKDEISGTYMDEHLHCNNCFSIIKCYKNQISKSKGKSTDLIKKCSIVTCIFNCGAKFHSCKLEEHLLLCPRKIISCINSNYGCPFRLERQDVSKHLERCPASVCVCTMEWNRKPLLPNQCPPFKQDNCHLDVASLNCDKETLRNFHEELPSSLRKVLKSPTSQYPIVPLGVSGHRIPESILNKKCEQNGSIDGLSGQDIAFEYEYTYERGGISLTPPPGLCQSVCHQLHNDHQLSQNLAVQKNDTNNYNSITKLPDLSINVEVIAKHSGRYHKWFTFMCSREFRRDEIAQHFKSVHTEIITQLNGWLFRRCPLFPYGCNFGTIRKFPVVDSNNYIIKYNDALRTFSITNSTEYKETDDAISLESLPVELLLKLTNYLDPLSLSTLSMTSRRLRDICAYVLPKRGIVVHNWEKQGPGKWRIKGNSWLFSTSFATEKTWRFSDTGTISEHMKNCSVLDEQRNCINHPFSYNVNESDL